MDKSYENGNDVVDAAHHEGWCLISRKDGLVCVANNNGVALLYERQASGWYKCTNNETKQTP